MAARDGLSEAEVRKVAQLARLALPPERLQAMQRDLGAVLGYVERLRTLNLEGVEPMAHVGEATNRLDDDTPGPTLAPEALKRIAPETLGPFLKVPKVLGEGGGA